MTWFAFPQGTDTLQVFNLNGSAEKAMVATAAHGYATMAEAVAKPNASPNAAQDVVIAADQQSAGAAVGGGTSGVLEAGTYNTSTKKFTKQGTTAASVAKKAASAVPNLFTLTGVNGTNLAIRGAKIVIGGILLIVGIAQISGVSKGIVGTAVKAAPFL